MALLNETRACSDLSNPKNATPLLTQAVATSSISFLEKSINKALSKTIIASW